MKTPALVFLILGLFIATLPLGLTAQTGTKAEKPPVEKEKEKKSPETKEAGKTKTGKEPVKPVTDDDKPPKPEAPADDDLWFEDTTGPVVSYLIEAQLYPRDRELSATQTVTWRNTSRVPVTSLRFHLYYNAYRNLDTTFMRESGIAARALDKGTQDELRFGEIKINEIRRIGPGEPVSVSQLQYIAPDDDNEEDRTVAELSLADAVEPGKSIRLRFKYTLTIPQIFDRTGVLEDYYFIAHWFPKMGVLKPDGQWHCHQYHAHTEFFSDFGHYRVILTVPGEYIVGAAGNMVKSEKNANNSVTYQFEESDIHDFAWAASPEFTKVTETIHLTGNPRPTRIHLLLAPGHDSVKERYINALTYAMKFYASRIFPYPYKQITVIDPPFKAHSGHAMEFPTLITTSYACIFPDAFKLPEMSIIHEFGHQYWYGMIGSDETREAWLDEGVATFFELEILDEYFKDSASYFDLALLPVQAWQVTRMKYTSIEPVEPVLQESWKFMNRDQYEGNVYAKSAMLLRSLKHVTGRDRMFNFFRYYARKFKFKHPASDDFIDTFSAFMEEDYSWAFDRYIRTPEQLDHAVHSIKSVKISGSPLKYRNEAVFIRKQGYFPVNLTITLENGKEIKSSWQEREKWKRIRFEDESPIRQAVIDPGFKLPLDRNFLNNALKKRPPRRGIRRLALKGGFTFQDILSFLAF